MANGKLLGGKQSGGITTVTFQDGASNTVLVLPESGNVASTDGATVDNSVPRFDGVSGKLQGSGVTVDDSGTIKASSYTGDGVTQNAFDSTPGRLLKVGDFGIGGNVKNYDVHEQIQLTDYRKSVIALCELTNTNIALNSYSYGELVFHRDNSNSAELTCKVQLAKMYNTTKPSGFLEISSNRLKLPEVRLCTFTYNGVKYGGVHFYYTISKTSCYAKLSGNFVPFGLDYYDTQTSTAINAEVNNSLNFNDLSFASQGVNYHQGNVVGTVSQTAGAPTGAIIESGSNANGEYTKFADGTMICTIAKISATTTYVASVSTLYRHRATLTLPATFINALFTVSGCSIDNSGVQWVSGKVTATTTTTSVELLADTNTLTNVQLNVSVIGRWF